MKGRKPTPPNLKVLAGNPGRRPVPETPESPLLENNDPPPAWLHPYAQEFYTEIITITSGMRVATEADRLGITALAQSLAEVKIAHERMNEEGRVLMDLKGNPHRNPYAVHAAQFIAFVRQFITEYGMTPCSRARLISKAEGEENPLAAFLNRKNNGGT
jgi:P27 family predicted phage terminase small subunit